MTPVKQRVAPVGVLDVAFGLLALVAVDVADDATHVINVVVSVVRVVLPEDLDELATRLVALGLAPTVLLADLLGLVGIEPLLKLLAAHVDRLVKLLGDLLVALGHLSSSRLLDLL